MTDNLEKFIFTCLFFLLIFLTGFWVKRSEKPYSPLRFNIHKLIALAALVFLGFTCIQRSKTSFINLEGWLAVGTAGFLFLATMITGGLVSLNKSMPGIVGLFHKILPYFVFIAAAALLLILT